MTNEINEKKCNVVVSPKLAKLICKETGKKLMQVNLPKTFVHTQTGISNLKGIFRMAINNPKLFEAVEKIEADKTGDKQAIYNSMYKLANFKSTPVSYTMQIDKDNLIFKYGIMLFFGISHGNLSSLRCVNEVIEHTKNEITDFTGKDKSYVALLKAKKAKEAKEAKTIVSDDSIKAIDIKAKKSQAKRKTATSHKSGACVVVVPAKALAKA